MNRSLQAYRFWGSVSCALQTHLVEPPGPLQEDSATLAPGHSVLTLRAWRGTGLQKPRGPPEAECPDSMEMGSGTSPFGHCDSHTVSQSGVSRACPAEGSSESLRLTAKIILINC